jgi:hypothetical protein
MSLCVREIGNKKVLYIPKSLEDNFVEGRIYPVIVENKIVGLKCIRTAKRKVLYIPSQLDDLFSNGCHSFAYLNA